MTYKVNIQDTKPAFDRAYMRLIKEFRVLSRDDAGKLWQSEYNSTIIANEGWGHWESIEFISEYDYTMFVLRWT